MTIKDRIKKAEKRFDEIVEERKELQKKFEELGTELLKLQGEYRVLKEIEKANKPNKEAVTVESVPAKE